MHFNYVFHLFPSFWFFYPSVTMTDAMPVIRFGSICMYTLLVYISNLTSYVLVVELFTRKTNKRSLKKSKSGV
ncbi:hypothetical protein BC941DRAFT_43213 [Chlamydoabsidia padenii]|nr:hypothetical protein BC941DRAFT_43213 [Chlamydoabsidia padenii]